MLNFVTAGATLTVPVLSHGPCRVDETATRHRNIRYGAGFTSIWPIEPRSAISSVWLLK